MSSNFPIKFQLTAEDQASAKMQGLLEVLRQGGAASDDAKAKFQSLREGVTLQTRAMSTLGTEWRANNANLYIFGRAMQSVGAIGSQLLGIFNSLMLAQIAFAETSANLSQSTANIAIYTDQYNAALTAWGETDSRTIAAHERLINAQNSLISTQAQAQLQTTQLNLGYLGMGLSIGSTVFSLITLAKTLSVAASMASASAASVAGLDAALGFTGAAAGVGAGTLAGLGIAAAALGATLGILGSALIEVKFQGKTVDEAFKDIHDKLVTIPLLGNVLGPLTDGLHSLAQGAVELGNKVDGIGGSFEGMRDTLANVSIQMESNWRNAWQNINTQLGSAIGTLSNNARAGFNNIGSTTAGQWRSLQEGAASIWGDIVTTITDAVVSIQTAFGDIGDTSFTWPTFPSFPNITSALTDVVASIQKSLGSITGISFTWPTIPGFPDIAKTIGDAVAGAIAAITSITWPGWPSLPSIDLSGILDDLRKALKNLEDAFNSTITFIQNAWNGFVGSLGNISLGGVVDALTKSLKNISDAVTATINAVEKAWSDFVAWATGTTSGGSTSSTSTTTTTTTSNEFMDTGKPPPSYSTTTYNPMTDAVNTIVDAATSAWDAAADWLGSFHIFAGGGIATRPTLGVIGEKGPEAVIPLTVGGGGGMGVMGGGSTYHIYQTFQGSIMTEQDIGEIMDRHLYTILARLRQS